MLNRNRGRWVRWCGTFSLVALAALRGGDARADFAASCPVDWSFFGASTAYTFLGQPIADHETSADPSTGGASASPGDVDLASGSPGAAPGAMDTPAYGYFDGGTAYDPENPATLEDDYVLFRLRIAGDAAFKDAFLSRHWNVLVDVDDDGYKEYWVDLNGPYQNGNGYDQLQILYDNDSRQDIADPDISRVEEFRAYNLGDGTYSTAGCDTGSGTPSAPGNLNPTGSASFTRSLPTSDGTGDYWIEVQVPLTAFNDLLGNQVVYPNSPVAFVFSTSASNTDPLQKDWMMDLGFLSLNDPITFGDVVKLNGEPDIFFADAALRQKHYYEVAPSPACADPVYVYLKAPKENTSAATLQSLTVTVTDPATGDDDQVTLVETGPNSGVFANVGGATTPVSSKPLNAWIGYVATSTATVAETWTLTYVDASGTWTVQGSVSGLQPTNAVAATGYVSATGGVSFTLYEDSPGALASGDTVTFTTYAADPLCTTWSDGTADNSDNDGLLEAESGDTIYFSYTDPTTSATYTATADVVGACVPYIQFTRATGLPNQEFELNLDPNLSDQLYVTISFAPANTSPATAQTISVALGGYDTQGLTLTETGPDTGVFRNTTGLRTKVSDGAATANDALWEDVDGGVVTATYDYSSVACCSADPSCTGTATATSTLFYTDAAGRVNFTNASGTLGVVSYAVSQPIYVRVDDENLAACVPAVPTGEVTATITSDAGDVETVTLYETAAGSGVFMSSGVPAAATYDGSVVSGDGLLEARNLDTIVVEYADCDDGDLDAGNDVKTDTAVYRAPVIVIDEVSFQTDCSGSAEAEYVRILNAAADAGDPANTKDLSSLGYALSDGASVDPMFFDFTGVQAGSLGTADCPGAALNVGRNIVLEPGDSVYVFFTNLSQLTGYQTYCDDGVHTTFYLYAYDASYDGNWLSDVEDQVVLEDGAGNAEDYVAWSSSGAPAADFLSDDAAAVTAGIWQDNAYRDVSGIADCSALARLTEGYDTNVPGDWGYAAVLGSGGPVVTQAVVSSFEAALEHGTMVVSWETASENGTLGWFLKRRDSGTGGYQQVNSVILPALFGSPQGGAYRVADPGAAPGASFEYLLEELEVGGATNVYGPYAVRAVDRDGAGLRPRGLEREPRNPSPAAAARRGARGAEAAAKSSRRGRAAGSTASVSAKIAVAAEGLHRIAAADIASGLGVSAREAATLVRRRRLALSTFGSPVAWTPASDGDGILFFARVPDDLFSATNVYWLSVGEGTVMGSAGRAPRHASEGLSFPASVHQERDVYANAMLFSDPRSDYWQWQFFVAGFPGYDAASFPFDLAGLAAGAGPGRLDVTLVGGMWGSQTYRAALELNGVGLGDCLWQGTIGACAADIPAGVLRAGGNALTITAVADGGSSFSIFHLDSFDVTYDRSYRADGGSLLCTGGGNPAVTVDGFAGPDIAVLDLSDPDAPALVEASVAPASDATWGVSFVPTTAATRHLAADVAAAAAPDSVERVAATALRDEVAGADYLVIAPEQLLDAAGRIADYRAAQGHVTRTVSFESVVDEFGFGIRSPDALRAFLAQLVSGPPAAPLHVLLVGEGSFDYRNLTGAGDNLLPVMLVATGDGLVPSDTALADANGDGVPDLAIGRLPALTSAEVDDMLEKIRSFEFSGGSWRGRALWLADRTVAGADFAGDADAVALSLPASVVADKIYLSSKLNTAAARSRVLAGLGSGAMFLNYFGHAGLDRLSADGLLTAGDVTAQGAAGVAPIVTAMTCMAGQFAIGGHDSLAETLVLKRGGGATAVWSSSGLSANADARLLDEEFYRVVSAGSASTLGEATRIAALRFRQGGGGPDLPRLYNLLGDPALRLR